MNSEKYTEAFNQYANNNIDSAESICKGLLLDNPNDTKALNLYSIIMLKKNRIPEAFVYLHKTLVIQPDSLDALVNLANLYRVQNQLDKAIEFFQKIILLNPDHFDAYFNLGNIHFDLRNLDESEKYFKKVLEFEPTNIDVIFKLGGIYYLKGNYEEALVHYTRVANFDPNYCDVYVNIGVCHNKNGNQEEAIKAYNIVLAANPNNAGAYNNLSSVYYVLDKRKEAMECAINALKLDPNMPEAYNNLSNVYLRDKDNKNTIKYALKALELKPDFASAYFNLGSANMKLDRDLAIKYFKKAIEINPDFAEAYSNLGNVYHAKKEMDQAIIYYRKATQHKKNFVEAEFNLSFACLANKEFEEGWKCYECRFTTPNFKRYEYRLPVTNMPRWDGSDLNGKTIYVYFEQGLGDTINFVRYLRFLKEMGAKILFKVQPQLMRIFDQNNICDQVLHYKHDDTTLIYDTHIPLLSLPLIYKTTNTNIPYADGYLRADKDLVSFYKKHFFDNDCYKIGFCWKGSHENDSEEKRSLQLSSFYKFAMLKNVKLYSLQKGYGIADLEILPPNIEIIDLGATFKDFADTIAAVENLDLVITIDTSVVHVAGAVGKKTWLFLPKVADWRWEWEEEWTPWYNSVKIFRQKEEHNWQEVVDRAYNTLLKTSPVKIL